MKNAAEVKKSLEAAQVAINTAIDTTFASRQSTPGSSQAITRLDHASKAVQKAIDHVDAAVTAVAKKASTTAGAQA